jgi:hypothetical protein
VKSQRTPAGVADDHLKRVRVVRRGESSRPATAANEERRRGRSFRDLRSHHPEPFLAPAVGDPDDEQSRAAGGVDQPRSGLDEHGLRRNSRELLNDERGVPDQLAGVALAGAVVRRSQEPERGFLYRRDPSGELERSPVVIGAAEGNEHRVVTVDRGNPFALDEHGDVARRVLEHGADVAAGYAFADEGRRPFRMTRSTSCSFERRTRSEPGSGDVKATVRLATPCSDKSWRRRFSSSV